ncbi:hypothetical protein ACFU6O_12395 [Streptomyces albidoflavus]
MAELTMAQAAPGRAPAVTVRHEHVVRPVGGHQQGDHALRGLPVRPGARRRQAAVHRLLSAWRIRRRRHALLGAKSATVLAAVIAHGGAALLFTLATPRPGLGLGGVLLAGGVSALLAVGAAACLPTARRETPAAG